MSVFSKYKVVLSGNVLPNFEREVVLKGLADLFNSTPKKMEKLLGGNEVPLKKEYDRDQAVNICQKIRKIGAECKLDEIPDMEITLEQDTLNVGKAPTICPACQNLLHAPGATCQACGYTAGGVGSSARYVESGVAMEHDVDEKSAKEEWKDKIQRLLDIFVQTNKEYYQGQFAKFGSTKSPKFAVTWHWPAFFFFFFWALYRKLWIWAGIYLLGGVGLSLIFAPGPVYLIWAIIWPICANYIYFRKASVAVNQVVFGSADRDDLEESGGISKFAMWIGLALVILASVVTSNHLTKQFIEKYGDDLKEVVPGSGTQLRGDGSPIEEIVDNQSKLGLSSLKLSYLGTQLKILLVQNDNDDGSKSVLQFENQFADRTIVDSWDVPIELTKELDRFVLKSAGPDQAIGTDDDILQPVYFQ